MSNIFWSASSFAILYLVAISYPIGAQILPDSTIPNPSVVTSEGDTQVINGGTAFGSNLFHSFEQFSVLTGNTAYFNNAADIQNIISRVTGGSVSNIDGQLKANGTANLFILNPNGIIFGEKATLNIGGSFMATTASSLKFADGNEFSVVNSSNTPPLLTISVPTGLQFGNNPGRIIVQGSGQGIRLLTDDLIDTIEGLHVQPDKTLALVGGDLTLAGGTLKTAGGRIELGSVDANSFVSLTPIAQGIALGYESVSSFRDIQLSDSAAVDASGLGGGDIQVRGKQVTLTNGSQIEASTLGSEPGGSLIVTVSDSVELIGFSANSQLFSGLFTGVYPGATGDGGNLTLETRRLILRDGARIGTATFSNGAAGTLRVTASDLVELSGKPGSGLFPYSSLVTAAAPGATGAGGNLIVDTTAIYVQAGDEAGVIGSQINQAQALEELGFNRRALATLTQVNKALEGQPDSLLKANGLRSFGNVLQEIGDLDQSRQVLQQSLAIAKALQSSPDISLALFSLGNLAHSLQDTKAALDFYQQAEAASASPTTRVKAQLNQLSLLLETGQESVAQALWPQIQAHLAELPASRATIYARINYAQSLTHLQKSGLPKAPSWVEIAQVLATAVQEAKNLGDQRATAYALGNLGGVYEATQQWSIAQNLTQQALLLAETNNAPDIAYRWQWQLGRILKAGGDIPGAIAAYTEAVNALESLRADLVAINPDVQFSFQEGVEPVYRELVDLLLQPKGWVNGGEPSQENLLQARDVIESLQLAELVNFFRENCLSEQPVQIDQIDQKSAVIYPIILNDRLEVILSLPEQPLNHFTTPLSPTQFESTMLELRNTLQQEYSQKFLSVSQQVYDWLIRPLEAELAKSGVQTLVFLLDGSLRNIPMASLYDGQHYLVEKYAVALTPGLQLLDPKPLVRQQIKVLTAGISEARQDFSPLPNVELELKEIQEEVPGRVLLNQTFTSSNLQKEIKSSSFPVVHLATHGQFSSNAEDTFLLTWDDRITIKQLNNLLKTTDSSDSIIELLVLSACQTAVGDKRAALGLAGMAVRAGARSTLASLWSINDAATASFMISFYQNLNDSKVTKAEALRRAQLSLLQNPDYSHPYYWSPFVLVGNWL